MPDDYEENFKKADETYLYQLVYDPRTCQQVRLHPMPAEVSTEQLKFAGVYPLCIVCNVLVMLCELLLCYCD